MLTLTWPDLYRDGGALRRKLMPRLDARPLHQARMNLSLARKIVELAWEHGWLHGGGVVVSPMLGEGSELLMAGLVGTAWPLIGPQDIGLRLYGIEVSALYADRALQYFNMHNIAAQIAIQDARAPWPADWPKFDLAVFSPTYEGALTRWCEGPQADSQRFARPDLRPKIGGAGGYDAAPGQVGGLVGDAWRSAMREIYARCAENAAPTAKMVLVTKNRRRKGKLIDIASMSIADCGLAGWTQIAHIRATGAATSLWAQYNNAVHYKAKGREDLVIEHEDITVYELSSINN